MQAHILDAAAMHSINILINDDEAPLADSRHWLVCQLARKGTRHNITQESLQETSHQVELLLPDTF